MDTRLTPAEAARAVAEAARYEDTLQHRTEGITWMIWGLATPGIFVTYAFAALLGASGYAMSFLWVPWVAAGTAATFALWQAAALARPCAAPAPRIPYWLRAAAFSLLLALAFGVVHAEGPEPPLVILGLAWAAMGALDIWRTSRQGRLLAVIAGGLLALLGATLLVTRAPIEVGGTLSLVASGVVPMATGLYQVLRG